MSGPALRVRYAGLGDDTGYAEAARRLCAASLDAGIDLEWCPVRHHPDRRTNGWLPDDGDRPDPAPRDDRPILVGHTPIDTTPGYRAVLPHRIFLDHTVWETDRMPPEWLPMFHDRDAPVHGIIVPTEWNAETFRAGGVRIPIHVVPHVAPTRSGPAVQLPIELPDDRIVFTTVSVWQTRKAPERAISAFLRAFTADDPVALVVKTGGSVVTWDVTWRPDVTSMTWWRVANLLRGHRNPPPVILAVDPWDRARMDALYDRTDCFVSLPSGEGWGLGAFDVATRAKPVITTGFGGPLAYLGDDHPGLVAFRPCPAEVGPKGEVIGSWADPDLDHAVALLRSVVEQPKAWSDAAMRTATRIEERFSPAVVAADFRSVLQQHA